MIQFDPKLGKSFGFVDIGGRSSGGEDVAANEALVFMLVGFRSFWKITIAYFFIKGITSELLAGMIREAITRSYEAGVNVRTVTMDGTVHNISAFNKLGCELQPSEIANISTSFPHPHPDSTSTVFAICDAPHMAKNCRNILAEYQELIWPDQGIVKWDYIVKLHALQEKHGLRLGNKITAKHVHFRKNIMRVHLATQVMSDSVSRSLKWAHENCIEGFTDSDVLTTAKFLELHDQLFDILNSRTRHAFGVKAALTPQNVHRAEIVFSEFIAMYDVLTRKDNVRIIHSKRRTGPLGFIACIVSVRSLVELMSNGEFKLNYLRCHKIQQDHLERFFSAIRQRNGWNFNPTPQAFRYSLRQLMCHAGKNIIHSATGNCLQQDETVLLSVANFEVAAKLTSPLEIGDPDDAATATRSVLDEENNNVAKMDFHDGGCIPKNCRVCAAAVTYIAGYYVHALATRIKCSICKAALSHSEYDPCCDASLIYFKDYRPDTTEIGLKIPSGSLCNILFTCEKVFRNHLVLPAPLSSLNVEKILLVSTLAQLDMSSIFPTLSRHMLDTSDGIDSHFFMVVHLVCRKYLRLRVKKVLRDCAVAKTIGGKDGRALHRSRIVQNV